MMVNVDARSMLKASRAWRAIYKPRHRKTFLYRPTKTKIAAKPKPFRDYGADEVGPRFGQKVKFGYGDTQSLSPKAARVHGDPRVG